MDTNASQHDSEMYDVVIVGGGVVGCSVLRSLTLAGYHACLVEAETDLLTHASGSNSGIICTGVDAPLGSLERALIRDSISQIRPYCQDHGIPFRPCGSLVCSWKSDHLNELNKVLDQSHQAGDTHASRLDSSVTLQLETHLNPSCCGAVHIPGEIVVDPWLLAISYAVHARENGATVYTNFEVNARASSRDGDMWTLVRQQNSLSSADAANQSNLLNVSDEDVFDRRSTLSRPPQSVKARIVINAAGVWADTIQTRVGCSVLGSNSSHQSPVPQPTWKTQPRRGQYRMYGRSTNEDNKPFLTHPIQPVPTHFTKGIFVFSTLYGQIVVSCKSRVKFYIFCANAVFQVGPTATEQVSRTDRLIDPAVANNLDQFALHVLPSLNASGYQVVCDYVGIRPATTERDYQIRAHHRSSWITVAGIRSTGLTASLGIGRHVLNLIQSMLSPSDCALVVRTTPLPPVERLVRNYRERLDGKVTIAGHDYKVAHPITMIGWKIGQGVAKI